VNAPDAPSANRLVYKRSASREIPGLLQTAFAAELLSPSPCVWVVSAWIWDIPVLDNASGGFRHLDSSWPNGPVRLVAVLAALLDEGTTVHVAARPRDSQIFLQTLKDRAGYTGAPTAACPLFVHDEGEETQHQKGILTSKFYLRGTMNLTHNGIEVNDEHVEYTTAPDVLATAAIEFESRWGGAFQ
jgi:hypothetical protein